MKKIIFIIALVFTTGSTHAGWFSGKKEEANPDHDRRIQAEDQVTSIKTQLTDARAQIQQEHVSSQRWQSACIALSVACPALLVFGAILGASTRRKHARE